MDDSHVAGAIESAAGTASTPAGRGGLAPRRKRGVRINATPTIASETKSVPGRPTRESEHISFNPSATIVLRDAVERSGIEMASKKVVVRRGPSGLPAASRR